jgi:hypothetical protein
MFVPIRVITRSFVVFQFLLCVFVGSNVAIAEPKVDYGINVKKAHQDFLAMPEAKKKKKITQDGYFSGWQFAHVGDVSRASFARRASHYDRHRRQARPKIEDASSRSEGRLSAR